MGVTINIESITTEPDCWSRGLSLPNTFIEIDNEIFSMVILLFPLIQDGDNVSYKRKYVHMGESFQDYSWIQDFEANFPNLLRWTDHLDMSIAVD